MTILFGIPNCDTCRKARRWLDAAGVEYTFHDLRANGVNPKSLQRWLDAAGQDTVLNRRGTTWRKLPETAKTALTEKKVFQLLLEHPSLIKRPILESGKHCVVGFDADAWQRALRAGR